MEEGVNRYYQALEVAGIGSLNESALNKILSEKAYALKPTKHKPCIFLSHKSEDKTAVKRIGDYIKKNGIDIYLDVDDKDLQNAVRNNDHSTITKAIEIGIYASTNLMSLISEKTKKSWWVPYEIGFAKSEEKYLSTLKLKDVSHIPSFLFITKMLKTAMEFDKYLSEVKERSKVYSITELILNKMSSPPITSLKSFLD